FAFLATPDMGSRCMRRTASPPAGMVPENNPIRLGPDWWGPIAGPSRVSASGAIPYESKLTSSLAFHTPASSTTPLGDLWVKVPAAVTDLFGVVSVPT